MRAIPSTFELMRMSKCPRMPSSARAPKASIGQAIDDVEELLDRDAPEVRERPEQRADDDRVGEDRGEPRRHPEGPAEPSAMNE